MILQVFGVNVFPEEKSCARNLGLCPVFASEGCQFIWKLYAERIWILFSTTTSQDTVEVK
jgi:hypothetical protein